MKIVMIRHQVLMDLQGHMMRQDGIAQLVVGKDLDAGRIIHNVNVIVVLSMFVRQKLEQHIGPLIEQHIEQLINVLIVLIQNITIHIVIKDKKIVIPQTIFFIFCYILENK